jgi:hypothetical protein
VLILYFYVQIIVRPDRLVLQESWLYRLLPVLMVFCVLSTRVQFSRFYFVWIQEFYVRHVFFTGPYAALNSTAVFYGRLSE